MRTKPRSAASLEEDALPLGQQDGQGKGKGMVVVVVVVVVRTKYFAVGIYENVEDIIDITILDLPTLCI